MHEEKKIKERNKFLQLWLIIGIVAGFATVIFFLVTYFNEKVLCDVGCRIKNEITLILVLLSFFGMFIGSLIYYFISEKYEKRIKKIDKSIANITLRFLDEEEKKVFNAILENDGKITQSEISKRTGFSRVRIFRFLKKFERKKIITKKPHGMTNFIELEEKLRKIFLKE